MNLGRLIWFLLVADSRITKLEEQRMVDRAELDAALAAEHDVVGRVVAKVVDLATSMAALEAKVAELGHSADLQAELDAVKADTAALAGVLPAPAVVAPEAPVEAPVAPETPVVEPVAAPVTADAPPGS